MCGIKKIIQKNSIHIYHTYICLEKMEFTVSFLMKGTIQTENKIIKIYNKKT